MKKIIKENIKVFFGILIGLSLGGVSVFASSVITSKDVFYENTLSNVNNVQKAIEELYVLAQSNTPEGYIISENGIRYTGKNPNNYVSFNGELWRIIGIFDGKIKIIRNESIGSKPWNSEQKNDWGSSSLYNYLNATYYNSLESTSKNMVENATWKTGGASTNNITALKMYEQEESVAIITGYVGLMSASDYGYASSECQRKASPLMNYDNVLCISTNWLKLGAYEWTMTPFSSFTDHVFSVGSLGFLSGTGSDSSVVNSFHVRPVLYLKSKVHISSGSGTHINPYQLAID